jgi:hypothetical protein
MLNAGLTDADFGKMLSESEQDGFLDRKATVVELEAGQKLYKLSSYPVKAGRTGFLSAWWTSVTPFKEDTLGARGRYQEAVANGVSLREMVRFVSAVRVDWNDIEEYQEITLKDSAKCFWGEFGPQPSSTPVLSGAVAGKSVFDMSFAEMNAATTQLAKNASKRKRLRDFGVYVPDTLGGIEAWQFFIPQLKESDMEKCPSIPSHDMAALALHLSVI